jgi:transposase
MDTVFERCAGIDVHKKRIQVCLRILEGRGARQEVREFSTVTRALLELGDWLASEGVTHVAMESTGVLWKPVYNLLEGRFTVLVCNAQHLKQVPGRKTDIADCQWIAQLLQHGLLRNSFIPSRSLRDLRDLTRERAQFMAEITRVKNRVQKILEDANIKLSSVATDVFGVSGRAILEALMQGETDARALAQLARGRLRAKREDLEDALHGAVSDHHRFMIETDCLHLRALERLVQRIEGRIEEMAASHHLDAPATHDRPEIPFESAVELLDSIPGVNRTMAQTLLAEIGIDMRQFPTAHHLASWAGMCPGNNESAGKRKSGKTTKGNCWLRRAIVQAAWAASRQKESYLSAQYNRIARRRGKKRAIVAVANSLLVIIHQMLTDGAFYHELGHDYFDKRNAEQTIKYHVKKLESLGHVVHLELAA